MYFLKQASGIIYIPISYLSILFALTNLTKIFAKVTIFPVEINFMKPSGLLPQSSAMSISSK